MLEKLSTLIEEKDTQNERLRRKSEEIIKLCGKGVQKIHNDQLIEDIINKLKGELNEIKSCSHPLCLTAIQEYVELIELNNIKMNNTLLDYEEIENINLEGYILGLSDVIGELRREILNSLLKDRYNKAQKYFQLMEWIYESLHPIRVSNSTLPGFRRKMDVARSLLESSRRDLFMYKVSRRGD